MKITTATLMASASLLVLTTTLARADDYKELLDVLLAKGSLTQGEYTTLLRKHQHPARAAHHMGGTSQAPAMEPMDTTSSDSALAAVRAQAAAAAASAASAEADMQKMAAMEQQMTTGPGLVHMEPYKPGGGITIRAGDVDLNFSGIVNGYYTYSSSSASNLTKSVSGGIADGSGFDSSAVRNGLLPGAFIVTASTKQEGIDVSAVFGVFPGINSSTNGLLNANSGGAPVALGTAGGDFRKMYLTFGTPDLGTVKVGRDIGIFGSDAILNDASLLSVGATGGNAAPGNTSLGRIGVGYIYTDFMPQISYTSPTFAGFQATLGVVQPLDEFAAFVGSEGTTEHSEPLFEGKLTYDLKSAPFTAHLWAGFMSQDQQGIVQTGGNITSKQASAGEVGGVFGFGPAALTAYYYKGTGVGTEGKFFGGIAYNGEFRESDGGYIQGSYKITPKFKLVGSWGISRLQEASGEIDPTLVKSNTAAIGAGYYNLTDWVTLVGEYANQKSEAHDGDTITSNAFTAGAILFY